jgi:hypothetical protein
VVIRGDTDDDFIWLASRTETETWLCNHCSDYLAPGSPMFFGRILRMGSKWEAIWHVQTEYVRCDAAMFIPLISFLFYRHNVDSPLVDVDVYKYPIY